MATSSLFDKVVSVTYVYLGPAADRFVSRQISNHLHKKPDQLKADELHELIDWIRLAMSFLTEDQVMIQEYIGRLEGLERKQHTGSTGKPAQRVKTKRTAKSHADAN